MKYPKSIILPTVVVSAALLIVLNCSRSNLEVAGTTNRESRPPIIHPDYSGTVIPPNIAPLNFVVVDPGSGYNVKIYSTRGDTIRIASRSPKITIPLKAWKKTLDSNRGEPLCFDIRVRDENGDWHIFEPITNEISDADIDEYLTYRRIKPLYNFWRDIHIHQRNLTNFNESLVLSNKGIEKGCCNCHTFLNKKSDVMLMHTRSSLGVAMLLIRDGEVTGINSRTPLGAPIAYSSWHPSGRLIAFSVNRVKQFFHSAGKEIRDVIDLDSSLGIYSVDTNTIADAAPELSKIDRMETYPMWSPDGRYLYFCAADMIWSEEEKVYSDKNVTFPKGYKDVRYDLMRIGYDIDSDTWGELEKVLSSDETGKSITQPKISPDGRHVLFCMADYGCFPIFQPSCDLYMMDIDTGSYQPLEGNSDKCDSWHSWSHNSRWIVFSSKRGDGLYARPHISYVDSNGRTSKPFILPQKDPEMYDTLLDTFNVPELSVSPIDVRRRQLYHANAHLIPIEGIDIAVTAATPQLPSGEKSDVEISPEKQ